MRRNDVIILIIILIALSLLYLVLSEPPQSPISIILNTPSKFIPIYSRQGVDERPTRVPVEDTQFGFDLTAYDRIVADEYFSPEEIRYLYTKYYIPLPGKFEAAGVYFGNDQNSFKELQYYGKAIRAEMQLGFVLVASGQYGYHPELEAELKEYLHAPYGVDVLLSKESSPLYNFLADGGADFTNRDKHNQRIPVTYEQLNQRQKRIYDLTKTDNIQNMYIEPYKQSQYTESLALFSGKYVAFVSCKSPNDIGRRFLIYHNNRFIGVVLVVGTAKLSDWTGYGEPTNDNFRWYNHPIGISTINGDHIAFDIPETLYKYLGGSGGGIDNIIAIDPDVY
jgi:hypothetical protein